MSERTLQVSACDCCIGNNARHTPPRHWGYQFHYIASVSLLRRCGERIICTFQRYINFAFASASCIVRMRIHWFITTCHNAHTAQYEHWKRSHIETAADDAKQNGTGARDYLWAFIWFEILLHSAVGSRDVASRRRRRRYPHITDYCTFYAKVSNVN